MRTVVTDLLSPSDRIAGAKYFAAIDLARRDRDEAMEAAERDYNLDCAEATKAYLRALDHG